MNILLCCIIILIIVILYKNFDTNKSHFIIKTDTIIGQNKNIEETYNYPSCIGCITYDNKLKPNFKYNISDNRCVKNNSNDYINESYLQDILNYNNDKPINTLTSCDDNYNSLYSDVPGKYIILMRNDEIKMRFKHISVHQRNKNLNPLSLNSIIFASNIEKNENNEYIYPESVLNSTGNITFQNGYTYKDNKYDNRIVITLPEDSLIGYVNIIHENDSDAKTLEGAYLIIAKSLTNDNENGELTFYTQIKDSIVNRIIYTYNFINQLPSDLSSKISVINNWNLPCDNCLSVNNFLFKYHNYYKGNICYTPIKNDINIPLDGKYNSLYFNICTSKDNLYLFITNNSNYIPKIWLRANSGIAFSSSNYINNWTDVISNKVATANKSGTANYPTLDTTSESFPYIKIGNNLVSTTNGNYFDFGSLSFSITLGFSIIVVARFKTNNVWERIIDFSNGPQVNNIILSRYGTDNVLNFSTHILNDAVGKLLKNSSINNNTWQIFGAILTSTGLILYINTTKTTLSRSIPLTDQTYQYTYIGKSIFINDSFANIDIRELMIYDKAISTTDMESIITQLKTTYSL